MGVNVIFISESKNKPVSTTTILQDRNAFHGTSSGRSYKNLESSLYSLEPGIEPPMDISYPHSDRFLW